MSQQTIFMHRNITNDSDSFTKDDSPSETKSQPDEGNHRSAILLLDFQNEFAKVGGKIHDEVSTMMKETDMLRNVTELVDSARKLKASIIYSPIVFGQDDTFKDDYDPALQRYSLKTDYFIAQKGLFIENTWNCDIIHELEPRDDDYILKDRVDYSAFAGTNLQTILETNGIKHLFIMGYLTNVCVYQSSKDASRLLPHLTTYVVSDGCAAKSLELHQTALENMSKTGINTVSSSEAKSIIEDCAARENLNISTFNSNVDEWLLIDKIFLAAGVDKDGTLSVNRLRSLIGTTTPSRQSLLIQIFPDDMDNKMLVDEDQLSLYDREKLHSILFKRKKRSSFFEKLPLYIIIGLLPCFYSMSTRLPFIFLALEIMVERQGKLWQVGALLGAYQACRAFGNLLIVTLGGRDPFRRLHIFMVSMGLFGWLFSALFKRSSSNTSFFRDMDDDDDDDDPLSFWPLFALLGVGLSESIVNLQRSLMIETAKETPAGIVDQDVLGYRLGLQYAFVAGGSVFAFIGGGLVYTHYGFTAVCELGVLSNIIQLIGAITYIYLSGGSNRTAHHDDLDEKDLIRSVIYQFQTASVIMKCSRNIAKGTENAFNTEEDFSDFKNATRNAKNDRMLTYSLREMFQAFFQKKKKTSDDISSMENMLQSINYIESDDMPASKRPSALTAGTNKLAKLLLFQIKKKGKLTENEFVLYWAPRVYLSMFKSSQEASVSVVWPYMKVVVFSQAIVALCIGTFLSTALLSYTTRFNIEADTVGLLLGVGELLGTIAILSKSLLSKCLNKNASIRPPSVIGALFSRPLHVPLVLVATGLASIGFAIPNFMVAILCQMIMSSLNDTSVTLLNELIGTSLPAEEFGKYQGTGQWLRRVGNLITGILGPILFGLHQSFPFLLFGFLVFGWSIVLLYVLYQHADKIERSITDTMISKDDNKKAKSSSFLTPFIETSRTPWHTLEQRYYSINKEQFDEELNPLKKAHVDISALDTQVRRIAAALELEKDQRRALEDRIHAYMSKESGKAK